MKSQEIKQLKAMQRVEKTLDAAVSAMRKLLEIQPVPTGTPMREDDSRKVLIERMSEYSNFVGRKANSLAIQLGESK